MKKQNRLIDEKSPYLLQHAHNPVDWYPWGEEAFERAKREDKPIFLSVGYSTCHWCHVMAHESFENHGVAKLMNDAFVNIKVDREERPDIDGAYMTAAQTLTGSGGWPLTIIMTPEGKPFFAATYIPRETRYGRVGMLELIPKVKELWNTERDKAISTAQNLTSHLSRLSQPSSGEELGRPTVEAAVHQLKSSFDSVYGGFGRTPKFPTPHNMLFLLRHWKRTGDKRALSMVEKTLEEMRHGGLFDHLGFGFHRYSTDQFWLVPHFEKMLYDQALLTMAYAEAYAATGKEDYRDTAERIIEYLKRDMTSAEGAFYSAEDADSEGVEGKYYIWKYEEVLDLLSRDEAEIAGKVYNIEVEGNFHDEATRQRTGDNILHLKKSLSELASELDISDEELQTNLELIRAKLFNAREKRIRPSLDDKVLADWNGLAIAAFAMAGRYVDNPEYAAMAKKSADFMLTKMMDPEGRLLHTYKEGAARVQGFLEDYAYLVWGLLELYETTFQFPYLEKAIELNDKMIELFWDDEKGGFYHSSHDGERLIVRKKEVYDGATPSGNSVAAHNLLRLSRITGNPELEEKVINLGRAFSSTVKQYPAGYTHFLSAMDHLEGPSQEVVIVGDPDKDDSKQMIKALQSQYNPDVSVLFKPIGEEEPRITEIAPFTRDHKIIDGKATAYVCTGQACKKPTTDPDEMMKLLK